MAVVSMQIRMRFIQAFVQIFALLLLLIPVDKAVAAPAETGPAEGFLYFADTGSPHLRAWPTRFPAMLDDHQLGLTVLESLMTGPPAPDLAAAWPAGTRINAFFIGDGGRAWVDLDMESDPSQWADTMAELLAIYALVNSLTVNVPAVRQVKILVNGSDTASLGGHVSLEYFYKTNMLIVK